MISHRIPTFILAASLIAAGGCSDDTDTDKDTASLDAGADTASDVDTTTEDTDSDTEVDATTDAAEDTGADVDPTSPDVVPSLQGECGDDGTLRKIYHQGEMQQDVVEAEIPYNYGFHDKPDTTRWFYLTAIGASAERRRELYEIEFEIDPSTPQEYKGGVIPDGHLVLGQTDHPHADYIIEDANVVEFNFPSSHEQFPAEPARVRVEKKERGRPGDVWIVARYECWYRRL